MTIILAIGLVLMVAAIAYHAISERVSHSLPSPDAALAEPYAGVIDGADYILRLRRAAGL